MTIEQFAPYVCSFLIDTVSQLAINKTGIGMHVIEEISTQMHISATSFCY